MVNVSYNPSTNGIDSTIDAVVWQTGWRASGAVGHYFLFN
jgi:hypothetical protein